MQVMFTGNRVQKFDNFTQRNIAYYQLNRLIERAIKRAVEWNHPQINFISGMALGVDTAACEFVLQKKQIVHHSIKITLTAAVPCTNQDAKWRKPDKNKYRDFLSKCDTVHYVSNLEYTKSGGAKCLDARNKWMVSQLTGKDDMAITIHNGRKGGTQNAINDLISENKRVVIYNYLSHKFERLGNW